MEGLPDADEIVYLPVQTMADDTEGKATCPPMGSLFELVLFVFGRPWCWNCSNARDGPLVKLGIDTLIWNR
jgi:hypothetical protein